MQDIQRAKIDIERHNEIKKASFWISQFFILLATVSGVYLAASQGYKQAVQFENMISYKDNYYLQKSLQYELKDNINILNTYITKLENGASISTRSEPLNFYTLVWDNMKFSQATLATPPEYLRDAQRFYREVARLHDSIAKGGYSIAYGVEKLRAEVNVIEQQLFPALDKSIAEIEKILTDAKVVL